MDLVVLIIIGISFFGFIFGLACKSRAVNKSSIKKSDFFQKLTVVSLILMILFAIIYSLIT
ncbi:MAG: hypothetical protein DRH21_05345 [Deltaproteobacteria bacterium]|nr:MAG: hypothetical protein DRH21_05345 [Deltaproteobacteria bacterium]